MTTTEKLSIVEKVGYSLGDLSANLIFQTLMTFLAFFYTDVYKIPAAQASSIIFIGGIIGAFFNPIVGMIADRTDTRWGKFRPWILWTSVPFGIIALMAFSTPDFSPTGKVIYAFITYVLLLLVYSANNLPYSALSGVLTGNMQERNSLSAYRFVAVMVAQLVIQSLLLPLVLIMGDGDQAKGFENTMLLFSCVGVVFFIITFLTTKERIQSPSSEKNSNIMMDLHDLVHNRPWIIMLVVTTLVFVGLALKGGSYIYYFKYYLDEASLANFLQDSGFNEAISSLSRLFGLGDSYVPEDVATFAFSLFNAGGIIFMIVGIGLSKGLADKFGKRDIYALSLFVSSLFLVAFYFSSPDAIVNIFAFQYLHGFFYGISIPLLWAMIADVADYSEWKNGRRATAIIFAAMIFGLKAGLAIGGALIAAILASVSYDPNALVQTGEAREGIKLTISLFSSIPFLAAAVCMIFYAINKKMEHQIESDLKQRREVTPVSREQDPDISVNPQSLIAE